MTQKNVVWNKASPAEQILRASKLVETLEGLTLHEQLKHFDMSDWLYTNECGTVGCAAGQCGIRPWFRNRGFKIDLVPLDGDPLDLQVRFPDLQSGDFFGDELDFTIFTNNHFTMQGGGRGVYKQVLNAARLYVSKLKARVAFDKARAALDAAQSDLNSAEIEFSSATS